MVGALPQRSRPCIDARFLNGPNGRAAGRTPPRRWEAKSTDRAGNPQSIAARPDTRLAPPVAAVAGRPSLTGLLTLSTDELPPSASLATRALRQAQRRQKVAKAEHVIEVAVDKQEKVARRRAEARRRFLRNERLQTRDVVVVLCASSTENRARQSPRWEFYQSRHEHL